jgi:hypothetical protein
MKHEKRIPVAFHLHKPEKKNGSNLGDDLWCFVTTAATVKKHT